MGKEITKKSRSYYRRKQKFHGNQWTKTVKAVAETVVSTESDSITDQQVVQSTSSTAPNLSSPQLLLLTPSLSTIDRPSLTLLSSSTPLQTTSATSLPPTLPENTSLSISHSKLFAHTITRNYHQKSSSPSSTVKSSAITGYRIVDMEILSDIFNLLLCPECQSSNLKFVEDQKKKKRVVILFTFTLYLWF